MWMFFENGTFYSAVVDRTDDQVKWVRARDKRSADIFAEFSGGEVLEWSGRDYSFRVKSTPEVWEEFVIEQLRSAKATNFKSEVGKNLGYRAGADFLDALHGVWSVMFKFQNKAEDDKWSRYDERDERPVDVADFWDENPGLAARYGLPPF